MTTVLLSETQSRLSKALAERLAAREMEVTSFTGKKPRLPADCAALVVTDLAPALMVRPVPPQAATDPLGPDVLARIEALIDAAARAEVRIVLLSTPLPGAGTPETGVTRLARRLETCIAEKAPEHAVILRARDIVEPSDEALRTTIQALIDGSQAVWPQEEAVQPIALSDLAAALDFGHPHQAHPGQLVRHRAP